MTKIAARPIRERIKGIQARGRRCGHRRRMTERSFEELVAALEQHDLFLVMAESLHGWRGPGTPEGRPVMREHYAWIFEKKAQGVLVLSGPVDVAALMRGTPAVGAVTGLIVLRAPSQEAAQAIVEQDPLHRAGYRRNVVHALRITVAHPALSAALEGLVT